MIAQNSDHKNEGTLSERFLETLTNKQLLLLAEEKHTMFIKNIADLRNKLGEMSDSLEKQKMEEKMETMVKEHEEDMAILDFLKGLWNKSRNRGDGNFHTR